MIRFWANIRNLDVVKEFFRAEKSYTVKRTTYSTSFESDTVKVFVASNRLSFRALGLIQSLKKQVRECGIDFPKTQTAFFYRSRPDFRDGEYYEYDLHQAYLEEALIQKIIRPDLGEKIGKLRKSERMKVLGSLGTRRVVEIYKDGVLESTDIEQDEYLRSAWFSIVAGVDAKMSQLFEKNPGIFFYWVDQFYSLHPVEAGGAFKEKMIVTIHIAEPGKLQIGEREFTVPKRNKEITLN